MFSRQQRPQRGRVAPGQLGRTHAQWFAPAARVHSRRGASGTVIARNIQRPAAAANVPAEWERQTKTTEEEKEEGEEEEQEEAEAVESADV